MSSSYRNSLDSWLSQLEVKARTIIDIGGSQLSVKNRVKSFNAEYYYIADLPEPHKDSPKPDITMDLNKKYQGDSYLADIVFCLEVFDYVYDPMTAMKNIQRLLDHNGVAWVTFPSVYPLHQPIEDDALRYMPGGIQKLAKNSMLEIEEMIPRRPETNKWQEFFYAERMRGARGVDHSFTGWIVKFRNTI